jgi:hypothetical protein
VYEYHKRVTMKKTKGSEFNFNLLVFN